MKNLNTTTKTILSMTLAALLPLQALASQDQTSQSGDAHSVTPDRAQVANQVATPNLELKEGSPVTLSLVSALTSKSCREGDAVKLTVAEDVKVENSVAIRAGTTAMGHISQVKKSGAMGRGGELSIDVDYIQVNDTVVKLRGSRGKNGDDKAGAVVGLTVAFGIVGFMKHGKQAELPAGTNVHAYVDRTVELPSAPASAAGAEGK